MILRIPIKNRYIVSILLGFTGLGVILLAEYFFQESFREWEEKTLDYRFRLRKATTLHPAISTIGIEDSSLQKIGTWPWDRSLHGRMVALLKSLGVSLINFDIFFTARSNEPGDSQFIETVRQAGNVILSGPFELIDHPCFTPQEYQVFSRKYPHADAIISALKTQKEGHICLDFNALSDQQWNDLGQEAGLELLYHTEFAFTGEEDALRLDLFLRTFRYPFSVERSESLWYANRAYLPLQELIRNAAGFGHVSATPDSDGVFRRVPLVIRVQNQFIPHLAFAAVLQYLQVKPENVVIYPGKYIMLVNAHFPETNITKDIRIPVDKRLNLRINFFPSPKAHAFSDVLAAEESPEIAAFWKHEFEGHICTIGYTVSGTGDIGPNPLISNFPLSFIHDAIMNTILTEQFFSELGWGTNVLITALLLTFLGLMAPRLGPYRFTLFLFLCLGIYIGMSIYLFIAHRLILNLLIPVLPSLILGYSLITVYWYATEDRERKQLRSAFKTYVSKQMLTKILENPTSLALQGQRKELTIMFSDIRKFSTLSDRIEPEVVHRLLNMYFNQMTKIAFDYDGFVDKFIGDGLLCFFGDPIFHPDHALRAVQAAIDMQKAVRELGPELQEKLGLDPIVIRIGINTGYVIVGNMGSAERMEYTVLGSDVNLAQRLEASATPGQIMISHKTYEYVKHAIDTREIGEIKVKGFEHPVQVYEVQLPFES
ncbi:MAG: adenylate/guanylate cyclase domain-containing protein [Candidatus Vecturithrix sp.]|jgi:adenylate cyclase|nr:adenylate/guanylate cyclase domain-containing protein [Candidatus Vecturithrix sp.]